MHILLLFFDGWGLGTDDPAVNPFLTAPLPTLRDLFNGAIPTSGMGGSRAAVQHPARLSDYPAASTSPRAILVPTDATLGVEGLPQSGTGQTTILTGVNAARALGKHYGPYPSAALVEILQSDTIYHRLRAANKTAAFANAYPPFFFDRLARNKARRSAMTYAPQAAGVRLRDIDDLRAGRAVSAFVTNERWRELGADVPLLTARQAGQNLARLAREHDFTLFEYFLTDVAGHKQRPELTARVLAEIDGLYRGVLDEIDLSNTLFITTSDHGNLEDTAARGHTRNPVPTILIGAGREKIARRLHSLTDLAPALVDLLLEK